MFINLLSMSIMTPSHALIGILVSVPLLQYISPVDLQERKLLIPFLISDKVRYITYRFARHKDSGPGTIASSTQVASGRQEDAARERLLPP